MTLSIKDPRASQLARDVAKMTGGTMTEAVVNALQEKMEREIRRRDRVRHNMVEEILAIGRRCAAAPVLDTRSEDEILGYDENGIPTL